MSRTALVGTLAFLAVVSASSFAAAQEDSCSGWFCDDKPSTPTPAPTTPAPTWPTIGGIPEVGMPGVVTIPGAAGTPDVLSGTISEVVPGDHLTLKLGNGEVKVLLWSQLLSLSVSGKIVIGGSSGGSATPPPVISTPPPATVIVAPPPPPVAAPPPSYDYSQPVAPRTHEFRERWTLGVRLNFNSPSDTSTFSKNGPSMSNWVGGGTAIEADVGYRVSPHWTPYGFFEYGRYKTGASNDFIDDRSTSSMVGLGIRANTNPDGAVGFVIDLGIGYRWLTVPYGGLGGAGAMEGQIVPQNSNTYMTQTGKVTYSGFEALRLALGLSLFNSSHFSSEVLLQGSIGTFSHKSDANGSCSDGCQIDDQNTGAHAFGGISFGGHFDL